MIGALAHRAQDVMIGRQSDFQVQVVKKMLFG